MMELLSILSFSQTKPPSVGISNEKALLLAELEEAVEKLGEVPLWDKTLKISYGLLEFIISGGSGWVGIK